MEVEGDVEFGFVFEKEVEKDPFPHDYVNDADAEVKRCIGDVVKDHNDKVIVDPALDMSKTG